MEKELLKNWKFWIGIVSVLLIIGIITICVLRNNLTPEETISRFMYLVENKEYREAKKLCNGKLEKLDVLSNIKPSSLSFEFSDDKKNATSVIYENEIENTIMYVTMKNTLLGWQIQEYEVLTDLINPQVIEDRIKNGKNVSDIQLLYWGESDVSSKDEIAEYIEDNAMVAMIFAETMKSKNYDKANEMYQSITEKDLTVEQLEEYNWENYKIIDTFNMMKGNKGYLSSTTIELGEKKIWIYIAGGTIIDIIDATT